MGLITARLPQIPYIAFELVKVNMVHYMNKKNYKADQVALVSMKILPEQMDYELTGRDAITQTDKKIFKQGYYWGPQKVTYRGSFLNDYEETDGILLDGYGRLKRFEENIIYLGKETEEAGKYMYMINFYDFYLHRFGVINTDKWHLSGNGKENTNLLRYDLSFRIIGDLMSVNIVDALIGNILTAGFGGGFTISTVLLDSGITLADNIIDTIKGADSIITAGLEQIASSGSKIKQLKVIENIY